MIASTLPAPAECPPTVPAPKTLPLGVALVPLAHREIACPLCVSQDEARPDMHRPGVCRCSGCDVHSPGVPDCGVCEGLGWIEVRCWDCERYLGAGEPVEIEPVQYAEGSGAVFHCAACSAERWA